MQGPSEGHSASSGSWEQPLTGSQASTVQGMPSSHEAPSARCEQPAEPHPSVVQGSPSSHPAPATHSPPSHASPVVQGSPSSHGPLAPVWLQSPVAASQRSSVQALPSSHGAASSGTHSPARQDHRGSQRPSSLQVAPSGRAVARQSPSAHSKPVQGSEGHGLPLHRTAPSELPASEVSRESSWGASVVASVTESAAASGKAPPEPEPGHAKSAGVSRQARLKRGDRISPRQAPGQEAHEEHRSRRASAKPASRDRVCAHTDPRPTRRSEPRPRASCTPQRPPLPSGPAWHT